MADPDPEARPNQVSWLIPPGLTVEEVMGTVARSWRGSETERRVVRQTWLDSFDWRLHRHGWTLLHEVDPGGGGVAALELRTSGSDQPVRAQIDRADLPAASTDLPESRLRDTIGPVLGVRCLVPCAAAITTRRTLRVLNPDDKTVVRLLAESSTGADGALLGNRVRVVALRGYGHEAEAVDRFLARELGLGTDSGVMALALAVSGRSAGDYSSKLNVTLSGVMGIELAVKALLAHLLATVEANRTGACANLDPEYLHDMRVATRRARSLLDESAPYLADAGATAALRAELAWLGEVTGPTRDLDVWLMTLDDELAGAPPVPRELEALRALIEGRRQDAHRELVDQLSSARYQAFQAIWALASPSSIDGHSLESAGVGSAGARLVAAELVRRAHRRVLRRGRAIGLESPDEALHDLRKATKRLRYILESFESLCPGDVLDRLVVELKALQDNLGEFQDCAVQAAALCRLGAELGADVGTGADRSNCPEALIAIGFLVAGLERRRNKARAEFAERFARFDRPDARHLVDVLVSSLVKGKGAGKR